MAILMITNKHCSARGGMRLRRGPLKLFTRIEQQLCLQPFAFVRQPLRKRGLTTSASRLSEKPGESRQLPAGAEHAEVPFRTPKPTDMDAVVSIPPRFAWPLWAMLGTGRGFLQVFLSGSYNYKTWPKWGSEVEGLMKEVFLSW